MKLIVDYLYPKKYDHSSIPDLDEKVVIVTGGCTGLGYEIATQCALHNAQKIIIVSLPSQRLNDAVEQISAKLTNPHGQVIGIPADLADLSSVFHAVEQIKSITPTLDIFFANAGVSRAPTPLSKDGLETVFAINYVGHYALITRLLPILIKSSDTHGDVRIIMTSSSLAWWSRRIDYNSLSTPFNKHKDKPIEPYTRSKLACLLFGATLATHVRRRGGENIHVNIAEPGIIFGTEMHTQMESTYRWWVKAITLAMEWTVGLTVEQGALTMLYLGTSPEIKEGDVNGRFFRPFGDEIPMDKWPKNATLAAGEKLWDWSESFVSAREVEIERAAITHHHHHHHQ